MKNDDHRDLPNAGVIKIPELENLTCELGGGFTTKPSRCSLTTTSKYCVELVLILVMILVLVLASTNSRTCTSDTRVSALHCQC